MEPFVSRLLHRQTYTVLQGISPSDGLAVTGICCDSRKAVAGSFFFCLTGAVADGHAYAAAAYERGARVFGVEHEISLPKDAVILRFNDTRQAMAQAAAAFYGHPSRRMKVVGITGTKGKTTTALLIQHILSKQGIFTGYIGTVGVQYGTRRLPTVNTTPESVELQRHLYDMAEAGVEAVVLEVSSQALWMHRVDGVTFDACLFTNLSRDHVGGCEHPTFEHYRDCKKKLFAEYGAGALYVNEDDPAAAYMTAGVPARRLVTCGLRDERSGWYAARVTPCRRGSELGVSFACRDGGGETHEGYLPIPGTFNVSNALLALAVCCDGFGVPTEAALDGLACASVDGRFEPVYVKSMPGVTFLLDYAHNRASLKASLETLRDYDPTRLICLMGSVGDRSFERRSQLAEVAGTMADFCIVTSDNPGREPPEQIIGEILAAFPEGSCSRVGIVDRAEAIRYAVGMAQKGDIVLLAGKGHETYQLVDGQRIPFCERDILLEAAEGAAVV